MAKKILHLADLHLGSGQDYLGAAAVERTAEADSVLDRIADWITNGGATEVGAVLIAGDLFQTPWPEDALVTHVVRALERIRQTGVDLITVPGNHDEWTYNDGVFRKWASTWPGTLVQNREPELIATIELGERTIEVVSCCFDQGRNRPSSTWKNPFAGPRGPGSRRVGLFHGTLDRLGGIITEGERAFKLDFGRLAEWGIDYLALGHIHKRQSMREGDCLALYPGPIEGRGFDDPGSPDLCLVDLDSSPPRIQSVDAVALGIRSRKVATLTIDLVQIADLEALERRILAVPIPDRPPPILRVALRGSADFVGSIEELRRRLAIHFFHLEIEFACVSGPLGDWERLATHKSLEGIFVRKVIEKRNAADSPDEKSIWEEAATAGLRALGRSRE